MAGRSPIVEPGLHEMLVHGLREHRILAATEVGNHLDDCDMAIVCVGTPSSADGSHNMRYIAEVTREIAESLGNGRNRPLTVVYRSTIRPGTIETLIRPIFDLVLGSHARDLVELVYNPEFLRESTAVADYFAPPKIVVGTSDGAPCALLDALYAEIDAPRFNVVYRVAESTKFVDNTWHALKVAFGNEIGRICLNLGVDAEPVYDIFVADTKLNISSHYLRPGGAFGGSCLPKDVRALQRIAADVGANTHVIDALLRSNDAHKHCLFELASAELQRGEHILLVGLAFKAQTDDLRESPNVDLARMLLDAGYRVSIYDPAINAEMLTGANLGSIAMRLPQLDSLLLNRDAAECGHFARTVVCNGTARSLDLSRHNVVNLQSL